MSTVSLVAINAGLGSPSSSRMVADALVESFGDRLTEANIAYQASHIDLREHATSIANNFVTGYADASLQHVFDQLATADALIVVTPVFNASYSGLFKSFFDLLDAATLAGKPVILAATGGSERHSLMLEHAMRPLFTYLKAQPVNTAIFAATADWGSSDSVARDLQARMRRAADELAHAVLGAGNSVTAHRGRELAPDPGEPIDVFGANESEADAEHAEFASLMQRFAATEVDERNESPRG